MGRTLHALCLDGVYVHEVDDPRPPLEFRELDTPTHAHRNVTNGQLRPVLARARGAPTDAALLGAHALLLRTGGGMATKRIPGIVKLT